MWLQNAVVFYSYGTACEWLARRDTTRTNPKAPLSLWQVYIAGALHCLINLSIATLTFMAAAAAAAVPALTTYTNVVAGIRPSDQSS